MLVLAARPSGTRGPPGNVPADERDPDRALTKRYGDTLALDGLDLSRARARCTATSAPTAPARRRRSGCCSACTARARGRAELFGIDAWRDPVARPPPRRLRRRRAVPVAVADQRRDVRVPRAAARRHRRRLPRRSSSSASSSTPRKKIRALSKGNRQKVQLIAALATPRGPAAARRAHERPRPADGGRVPRLHQGGQGARPDGLPLLAHPQRGRGAVRPRRDPARRAARRRGHARELRHLASTPSRRPSPARRRICRRSPGSRVESAGTERAALRGHRRRRPAARRARRRTPSRR